MYIPYIEQPTLGAERNITFAIHSTRAGSEAFLSQVRQAVSSVNPNLPVAGVFTNGSALKSHAPAYCFLYANLSMLKFAYPRDRS